MKLSDRIPLLALLAGLGVAVLGAGRLPLVAAFELKTLDWRQSSFATPPPKDPGITLLMVDQESLDRFLEDGTSWPWPRDIYAALLSYLKAGGARAVAFDILFTDPSPLGRSLDEAFAKGLRGSGAVLAAASRDGRVTLPIKMLLDASGGAGDTAASPDPDGVFRRLPLASMVEGRVFPSLAAAVVTAAGGSVPPGTGPRLLRFRPRGTYPAIPAGHVVMSAFNLAEGAPVEPLPSVFKDRIVLIGLSAPGLKDLRPTPMSPKGAGTEVVATAVDNILNDDFLRPAPAAAGALLVLLGLLAGAAAARVLGKAWLAGLGVAGASAGLAGAAVLAYRAGVWAPMVEPQLALWLAFASVSAWGFAVEGRKKRDIQKAFSLYLSPQMVAEIAENPEKLVLGGERRELSCYFSDIENFTNFSEKLSPEKLTALMNRYLDSMTETVLESGGTLDKYIGDAIMAFWGAPLPHPGHALTACKVALANQKKLAVLREVLVKEGYPVVKARIGLNSGLASVGNMGSSKRFSYTALGDDINLASRLEGANKVYGTYILIAHATRAGAGDAVEVRELDLLKVKGKDKAVPVYELLGLKGEVDAVVLARARRFEEALALCRGRRFKEALAAFEALHAQSPADKACALYEGRCRDLLAAPPPDDWDGSFALTEK